MAQNTAHTIKFTTNEPVFLNGHDDNKNNVPIRILTPPRYTMPWWKPKTLLFPLTLALRLDVDTKKRNIIPTPMIIKIYKITFINKF
jgi:hypothetical protein